MLIEILKNPVMVDGIEVLNNIRLNVTDQHQLRLKMTYIDSNKVESDVDLVVFNWTAPKLEKLSLSISIDGKEMLRNIRFNLRLSYDFFKRSTKLRGKFGPHTVNKDLSNISDILMVVREYI